MSIEPRQLDFLSCLTSVQAAPADSETMSKVVSGALRFLLDKGRRDTRFAVIHGTDEGKDWLLRHTNLFIMLFLFIIQFSLSFRNPNHVEIKLLLSKPPPP
jgi:hypothetical protein